MKITRLVSRAVFVAVGLGVPAVACASAAVVKAVRLRRATRFRGKVVLVTGSSRGLGLALAEEFARGGAQLCLTARSGTELSEAVTLLVKRGRLHPENIFAVPADLRDSAQCSELIRQIDAQFGKIDILVNNAGVISVGPIENQTVETFRDVMDANFFAGVQCSLAAMPGMIERGQGTIVNIASVGGKMAVPHLLPYTASKFAVVGFSEGLHAEMRSKGIHVLTVCPGLMRTGSHLRALFSGDAPREYRWFSLLANLPGLSTTAGSAARQVAAATAAKKAEITITPAASAAALVAQVFPAFMATASSLVNAFLLPRPKSMNGEGIREGKEVRGRETMPASTFGISAARHYNQIS